MKLKELNRSKLLVILSSFYSALIIVMNILATKSIDVWIFTVTTGIMVSPLVFIIQDVVTELYGYKTARNVIYLGFASQVIAVILYQIAIVVPASEVYAGQVHFETILSTTPRITVASLLAYTIGSLINSKLMDKDKSDKSLFYRAIKGTVWGQLVDNAIFAVVAFAGVMPTANILSMIFGGALFEVVYEIILYPLTKYIIKKLKPYTAKTE